ncbi:MAG: hypothetical protein ACLUFV_10305 [Acutalibacteraceae bacterium]
MDIPALGEFFKSELARTGINSGCSLQSAAFGLRRLLRRRYTLPTCSSAPSTPAT